ncbi:hypothetical protein COOONC_28458 [Cooperia oncophora]
MICNYRHMDGVAGACELRTGGKLGWRGNEQNENNKLVVYQGVAGVVGVEEVKEVQEENSQERSRRPKETNNKSFHMEYYVENGVFVGSGTETSNKASESRSRSEIDNKNRLVRQETRNV